MSNRVDRVKNSNTPISQVNSPRGVQHIATQSTPKKSDEEQPQVAQKQIMKSDRSRKEERKEGLMNFKNKFEGSTQSRVSLYNVYVLNVRSEM